MIIVTNPFEMKLYLLHSTLILFLVTSATGVISQTTEEFDNLVFFVPSGFTVNKTNNSFMLSDATVPGGQYFTITINRSVLSLKKIEKSFPVFWRESLLNEGIDNPVPEPAFVKTQTTSGWNSYRGGKLVTFNPQSSPFYYHLTILRSLGITFRVCTRSSSEELFIQKTPQLMQLISSMSFKTSPRQNGQPAVTNQNNPAYPGNSGNAGYNQMLQLNGLYISVQGDLFSDAELAVLYFSPDGTVFTDIPEKGFFNWNMQQYKSQFPSLFGSFNTINNTVSVRMNNETIATSYTHDQNNSIQSNTNPSQVFKKIDALDNYQMEGSFINKQSGSNANIVFTRDGQFTDNGLIKTILKNNNEAAGYGKYSSRQNSLLLQYSDGRQLQLCFYMMPEDFQTGGRPDKILINNYVLTKQ